MENPEVRHQRNLLAATMVLGLLPNGYKGKKSKTKCQQKRKRIRARDMIEASKSGYTVRRVSRFKFIRTEVPCLVDVRSRLEESITKDSKIGRRFAQ
mgnify:CR=1 FL=1